MLALSTLFVATGCSGDCAELEQKLRADLGTDYSDFERVGGISQIAPKGAPRRLNEHLNELIWPQQERLCGELSDSEIYASRTVPYARYLVAAHRNPSGAGPRPAPPLSGVEGSPWYYAMTPIFIVGIFAYSFIARKRIMAQAARQQSPEPPSSEG